MKEGWKIDSIENLSIQLFAGGDVPKNAFTKIKTHECNIPIYSNGIENEGLYGYTNSPKVTEPALTIAGRGTIGYVFERNTPFVPIVRLITIIPNTSKVILRYFYYALKNIDFTSSGSSIPQLTVPMIKNKKIPLPSLEEQHRIVSILDASFEKIDALKKNAEENLKNAKALFLQVLTQELKPKDGWVEKKLGEFAYMKAGDFVKASDIHTNPDEGLFPCYGGNGLRGYVSEPNQEGDYCLIGRQGALCGCIHRVSGIYRTTEHAVVVKPYEEIPTTLVYYLLISLDLNKYATGAAQPGLSVKNISENVIISIPPLSEQHRIVRTLDTLSEKCRRLEEVAQQTIRECDALKQSILRQAFSGEL